MPTQHFTADSPRGMFIILPLKYDQPLDLAHLKSDRLGLPIIQNSPQFYSTDFIQLMNISVPKTKASCDVGCLIYLLTQLY